jgi:hypothetical protein
VSAAGRQSAAGLALALGALGLCSCVRARYQKTTLLRPIASGAETELAPGAELEACLARLGAPNFVWEQPGGAVAVAYAWSRSVGWGLGMSVTIARNADASFDYDDLSADTRGLVLWFDSSWRLQRLERGRIRDVAAPLGRPRPNWPTPPRESDGSAATSR